MTFLLKTNFKSRYSSSKSATTMFGIFCILSTQDKNKKQERTKKNTYISWYFILKNVDSDDTKFTLKFKIKIERKKKLEMLWNECTAHVEINSRSDNSNGNFIKFIELINIINAHQMHSINTVLDCFCDWKL